MIELKVIAPYFTFLTNLTFLILYVVLSPLLHSENEYIAYIRIIALDLAILSAPLSCYKQTKLIYYALLLFLTFYTFSLVFIGCVYIFKSIGDTVLFVDMLFGCLTIPAFYLIVSAPTIDNIDLTEPLVYDYPG